MLLFLFILSRIFSAGLPVPPERKILSLIPPSDSRDSEEFQTVILYNAFSIEFIVALFSLKICIIYLNCKKKNCYRELSNHRLIIFVIVILYYFFDSLLSHNDHRVILNVLHFQIS